MKKLRRRQRGQLVYSTEELVTKDDLDHLLNGLVKERDILLTALIRIAALKHAPSMEIAEGALKAAELAPEERTTQ